MKTQALLTLIACLTVCACSTSGVEETTSSAVPATSTAPSKPALPSATVAGDRIKGKIVETMNSGGFTYVAVEVSSGEKVWAAGPQTTVSVGSSLDINKGSEMKGFTSKTLSRTFETIYFVPSLGGKGNPTSPASAPASGSASAPAPGKAPASGPASAPDKATPATPAESISVTKAEGGHTIAEIFAQAGALANKEVLVRGRVVKFNGGIMGKNWLHLKDGTGDSATKTHDLTVTTDQTVAVGQTVLVKGVLAKDKDFGAGYKYAVILENATLEKK